MPEKEGKIRAVGDVYDIWDGQSKDIVIMDNNILALKKHFFKICKQIKKEGIRVDFNQGLDHKFLDKETVGVLKETPHKEYRFAFDSLKYEKTVKKAICLLKDGGINRCSWYVLVGFDTTFEEDLYRLNLLRERGQNAFVQRYKTIYSEKKYVVLARWANQHHIFQGMKWEDFLKHPENKRYRNLLKQTP